MAIGSFCSGQSTDPLVSRCSLNAGSKARYIKDFRIKLGKSASAEEMKYKASMSLWKDTKYRFTLCSSPGSKGQLTLNIRDAGGKTITSSYNEKTGKSSQSIDFLCNKSGVYSLDFGFAGGEQGSGVGVVSLIE